MREHAEELILVEEAIDDVAVAERVVHQHPEVLFQVLKHLLKVFW